MSRKKTMQFFSAGFTIIELLVVIAMISLLSSVIFSSLNSAREKARNARRLADMRQLITALELYFDKYGTYPPDNDSGFESWTDDSRDGIFISQLVTEGFLARSLIDPLNTDTNKFYFIYAFPQPGCGAYCLGFNLEPTGLGYNCPSYAPGTWPDAPPSVRSFCTFRSN